jgi:uncharacterized protein
MLPGSAVCLISDSMDMASLCVLLGAAAGGFVQGLSGFAFGLVAMAFWAWIVEPQVAGPMVVFGSLVCHLFSIGSVRRGFDRRRALPFLIGGLLGVPIGVAVLGHLSPVLFRAGVGAVLALYCPVMLFVRDLPRISAGGRLADSGAGFIGGVMGGIGGLTGPAPTLWCNLRGWDNDAQRAVFQSFNLTMQAATLALYATDGLLTAEAGWMFALIVPAMLLPTLVGVRLYRRFSGAGFRRLILALLSLSGFILLALSVPDLLR